MAVLNYLYRLKCKLCSAKKSAVSVWWLLWWSAFVSCLCFLSKQIKDWLTAWRIRADYDASKELLDHSPSFTFPLRNRFIQQGVGVKLIACVTAKPTPKVPRWRQYQTGPETPHLPVTASSPANLPFLPFVTPSLFHSSLKPIFFGNPSHRKLSSFSGTDSTDSYCYVFLSINIGFNCLTVSFRTDIGPKYNNLSYHVA